MIHQQYWCAKCRKVVNIPGPKSTSNEPPSCPGQCGGALTHIGETTLVDVPATVLGDGHVPHVTPQQHAVDLARAEQAGERPPCLEEYVHAGYDGANYARFMTALGKSAAWSNPDWKPPEGCACPRCLVACTPPDSAA
jgi:hypothetical protein